MNVTRLHQILAETTVQLRKGEVYEGTPELVAQAEAGDELKGGGVLHVYAMPHTSEAPASLERVDLHFVDIGVDKAAAEKHRAEFISILADWPDPETLFGGPSYITVGAEIGDQGAAFQMFALGKALGLWSVITPKTFGMEGEQANHAAGMGYIMMSGYRPEAVAA